MTTKRENKNKLILKKIRYNCKIKKKKMQKMNRLKIKINWLYKQKLRQNFFN